MKGKTKKGGSFGKWLLKATPPSLVRLFPDGPDGLSSEDKARVELANQLYHNMVRLMLLAVELGIPAVLENPKTSRFWETSFAAPLFAIHVQQLLARRIGFTQTQHTAEEASLFARLKLRALLLECET